MTRVAVTGGGATVAPAVLRELRRRGHVVVAIGHDADRLAATRRTVLEAEAGAGAGAGAEAEGASGAGAARAAGADERRRDGGGGRGAADPAPPPELRVVPATSASSASEPASRERGAAQDPSDGVGPVADAELVAAFADVEVVVHVGSPAAAPSVARAAIAAGRPVLDAAAVHPHHRVLLHDLDDPARRAGVGLVTGVGAAHLPGDLLTEVALDAVPAARELHVAAVVPSPGGVRAAATRGGRAGLLDVLAGPVQVWRDGEVVLEAVAESRRMAWFPRPIGPHHAVGIGGLEPLLAPTRHPGLTTVRSYLAVPGWQAELVQLAGSLARRPRGRRWVAGRLGGGRPPGPAARAATRWAVVAEAATGPAPEDTEGGVAATTEPAMGRTVARAWANGHDPLRVTAVGVGVVLDAVVSRGAPPGVGSPASVGPAPQLLDALSAATDLRWAVVRPDR
jgi:hypothetical protein